MVECTGSYFSEGEQFKDISLFDSGILQSGTVLYEVLRVYNGICLFLEDHIRRLQDSVILSGFSYQVPVQAIRNMLNELITKNNVTEGNIKILLHFITAGNPVLYTYFIPHSYPGSLMYSHGVKTDLYRSIRTNPNVKRLWPEFRLKLSDFIRENDLYEALLLADDDTVTEGSKSNVFFIQGESVLTAPGDRVLKGITREKIIQLCIQLKINLIEQPISIGQLKEFDAAFLTGTSPKVLPVRTIGKFEYQVSNPVMKALINGYNDLIAACMQR